MGYLFRRLKITCFGLFLITHFLHHLKITSFVNKYFGVSAAGSPEYLLIGFSLLVPPLVRMFIGYMETNID